MQFQSKMYLFNRVSTHACFSSIVNVLALWRNVITQAAHKDGDHKAFLAVHSASGTTSISIHLAKNARSHQAEEELVSMALLQVSYHAVVEI